MKHLKIQWWAVILLCFVSFQFARADVASNVSFSFIQHKYPKIRKTKKIDTLVLNVKDFGALGNGIQDDYNAITKALNSTQTPAKIYFPEGNYLITHPIATAHDGTVFFFKNAKLSIANNISGGILLNHNNCSVINAIIIGNGVSSTEMNVGYGVLLSGVSNCKVLNSTFTNISGLNIFLLNRGNQGCTKCVINGNNIQHPAFSRNLNQDASGIMIGYSGNGYFHTNNMISNNVIDGNGTLAHGIAIIAHGMDNTIVKNHVKNCVRYGIISYESTYVDYTLMRTNISNNVIENIGSPNGKPSPYGMGIYVAQSHYSIIKGNILNNCLLNSDNSETLPSGEISVNGSTFCTIDNNIIKNSRRYGITCATAFNTIITNNKIDGAAESGIYLINTANNTVRNNTIKNTSKYAIKGFFEHTSKPGLSNNITIKKYQNIATGQGVEISDNKIYSTNSGVIYMSGEDADPKSNYVGNNLKSVSIHDNIIIGNGNSNVQNSIQLDKVAPSSTNSVKNNKFQKGKTNN